jgi:hypothetical protein
MIWELRCAKINSFAQLVAVDAADFRAGLFAADGSFQDWTHRPAVEFNVDARKKKQPPRANVIFMKHGALVLDAKAKLALGSFLSKFGQLLELHLGGDVLWFYNVTNMVACLDEAKSERDETGMITAEAFDESRAPKDAAVFKDPTMGVIRIYVNDAGRAEVERLAADAGLTGIECGTPQRF